MNFGALGFCNKQKVFLLEDDKEGNSAKRNFKSQGILSSFAQLGGKFKLLTSKCKYLEICPGLSNYSVDVICPSFFHDGIISYCFDFELQGLVLNWQPKELVASEFRDV